MKVVIDYEVCENSAVCEQVCPEDVFDNSEDRVRVVTADICTECWICVDNCVSGAIEID